MVAGALFAASFFTTATLGALFALGGRPEPLPAADLARLEAWPMLLGPAAIEIVWGDVWLRSWGLRFAAATLFVLLCHELGHWFACRRHGLPATPPYFLPAPLGLGTFGAFIRIRAPIRTKRQLVDVGVSGPVAGFVALLPLLALGLAARPAEAAARAAGAAVESSTWLALGEPLIVRLFEGALGAAPADAIASAPDPLLLAAWVGLFATMLNLLPLAQLDGGHVLYAALGRRQARVAGPLWLGLAALGFLWPGWWLWCAIVLLLGLRHPPVVDERAPLDRRGRLLVLVALGLFVLSFMPVPIRVVEIAAL